MHPNGTAGCRVMAERSIAQQRLARAEFDSGVITDTEFETMKARVVGGGTPAS